MSVGDYGSLNIFSTLIADEEGHADWLQTQLELMDQLGAERYLSSLVGGDIAAE